MAFETEKLDVANGALLRLGAKPISDINELSDRATLCRQFIDHVRKEALRAHPWNISLHRLRLDATAQTTLTPGAISGTNVQFLTADPIFESDDVGQRIVASGGSARIVTFQTTTSVLANIDATFAAGVFAAGAWRLAPAWGNAYRYAKPANYLRVFEVAGTLAQAGGAFLWTWWNDRNNLPDPVKVEGKYLVSDVGSSIDIQFGRDIENPTLWDELLRNAIEALLAFRICYGVTGSLQASKTQWDAYKAFLAEARTIDGQESSADDSGSTILIDVRQ